MNTRSKTRGILNIVILAILLGAMIFATIKFLPQIIELVKDPGKFRDYLLTFGWTGVFVFIGFQALQVIIAAIPGELIQIAGGYIYGTFFGTIYSFIGILTGTVIVFGIIRLFGYSAIRIFVPEKQAKKYETLLDSPKSTAVMFMLYLIPGIPKDVVTYIAGLTPIKPVKFFSIAMLGRLPALIASTFIGSRVSSVDYTTVIILISAGVVLFAVGLIFREKILAFFTRNFNKKKD